MISKGHEDQVLARSIYGICKINRITLYEAGENRKDMKK